MHWTYPVPLSVVGWRNLYTVHDVIPLLHPELTHIDAGRYRRLLDRLALRSPSALRWAREPLAVTCGGTPFPHRSRRRDPSGPRRLYQAGSTQ